MSTAELNKNKRDFMAWINQLSNEHGISFLDDLNAFESSVDWWDDLSTSQHQLMWQNGVGWVGSGDLNLRTWYQSEHMTLTDQGYTKHYFIEGQRIASKLGSGFVGLEEGSIQQSVEPIHSELSELPKEATTRLGRDFECLGLVYGNFYGGAERLENMEELFGSGEGGEPDVYFYHSDHLGSSSFITDGSAFPTQHLQYLPFGEDFIHQQNTSAYYTAHTFSGKERDMETSFSYFGARYYDAGLSIWLSVDPMSDKYPHQSPFTYCSNNPVMRIDPNGEEDFEVDKKGRITPVKGTENNEGPDRLILLDKNGNQTDQIIEVKKGVLGNIQEGRDIGEFTSEDGTKVESPYDFTELAMTDGKEAVQLFNFLADNTDVEWSLSVVKGEKINTMILTSSHSEKHDARGGRIVVANSKVLLYHIHSHLDKAWYGEIGNLYQSSQNPGPGDQKLMKLVREISPTAIFEIRFQKENYRVD